MKLNSEQVIQGLINYADNEVMNKLPTSGKWVMGTAIGLAANNATEVIDTLSSNAIVKMLGIIDDNGMIDVDALIDAMRSSADRYGNLTVEVPIVGKLTFSSADVDSLRSYMR